jgi:hypothetical protein
MAVSNNGQPQGPIQFTDTRAGTRVFIGANTPTNPTDGDVWMDSDILNNAGQNLISTTTLTGSSQDISVLSIYRDLRLVIRGVNPSANANLIIKVNDDSTNYTSGTSLFSLASVKTAVSTNHLVLDILDTQDTTSFAWGHLRGIYTHSSSGNTTVDTISAYTQTNALTKVTLSLSTGTFLGGTVLVYGVN